MAKGDVKPRVEKSSRGSWGGSGGSHYYYDDEGRGTSKGVWEWFESNYTNSGFSFTWLMNLENERCYWLLKNSTDRFGLMDIAFFGAPGWVAGSDTRAHRLVLKHDTEANWVKFHQHLVDGYNAHKDFVQKKLQEEAEANNQKWAAIQAQRDAEAAIVLREDWSKVLEVTDITAGMLESDLNQAFIKVERVGDEGDWIEETVDTYIDGQGFGYESSKATGTKIQITLSLDLSNSMYYNRVHIEAAEAFRDLGMTLRMLKNMYGEDLYCALFTFSQDHWGGKRSEAGKRVMSVDIEGSQDEEEEAKPDFKGLAPYRPSKIKGWYGSGPFDGTDTHISPLFEAIENWERAHSDPGAIRLDLVITDAVLEHPNDIRLADEIQERRNGTLQTVMLNFMPEKEWLGSTLPKRCFQIKVDKDNIAGMLRNLIAEFVGAHL